MWQARSSDRAHFFHGGSYAGGSEREYLVWYNRGLHGGCSSVVELRTVAPAVVGSNPTTHPKSFTKNQTSDRAGSGDTGGRSIVLTAAASTGGSRNAAGSGFWRGSTLCPHRERGQLLLKFLTLAGGAFGFLRADDQSFKLFAAILTEIFEDRH